MGVRPPAASTRRRVLVSDLEDTVAAVADGPVPALVALEDLHWADDVTLEVLDRLAHRALGPMLVVATYRTDELDPSVPMRTWRSRLVNQRLVEEVRLARLTLEQAAELAAGVAGAVLPSATVEVVHRRSDGIPLHVEELVASAVDLEHVPTTLAVAVLARAQRLRPAARRLASTAAVIGRAFDIDVLLAVTKDTDSVDASLRELVEHSFVVPTGDGSSFDFRHALIRDTLAADLAPLEVRDLHARVAEAAAAAGMPHAFVSDHFERGRRAGPAYRHARAAAVEAIELSAHREAVDQLRRAQRTTPSGTSDAERAELLAALGTELAAVDENAAAEQALRRAYDLRRLADDRLGSAALLPDLVAVEHLLGAGLDARVARLREGLDLLDTLADADSDEDVAPETTEVRSRLLAALAAAYMLDRRLDEAIDVGRRALGLPTEHVSLHTQVDTQSTLGSVLVFAGRMSEGWDLLRGSVARARDAHLEAAAARAYRMIGSSASVLVEYALADLWLAEGIAYAAETERWNDRHYMAAHLAHVRWATGDWDEAERLALQSMVDGSGGITTRITALHVLGYLALGRDDLDDAERHLTEARVLGEEMGELQRFAPALWGLAEVALHSGRLDDAIALTDRGLATSDAVGDAAYLFPFVVTGIRARLGSSDLVGAREWLRRCAGALGRRGIPGTVVALDHARGLLALGEGNTGLARTALEDARSGWQARGRFWEGCQVLIDLARCAARSRRPGDAVALATAAATAADAAGARGLAARAAAVLADIDARASDPARPLTAREEQVALLVAEGLTNRQIAGRLTIAPKTVSAHIEHMLAKLDAGNRAEIAAWAARTLPGADPP